MTIRIWGVTDVGRGRSENQDTFVVACLPSPAEADRSTILLGQGSPAAGPPLDPAMGTVTAGDGGLQVTPGAGGLLLMVCDGMGGVAGGAVAAHLATSAILLALNERASTGQTPFTRLPQDVCEAIEEANRLVHERSRARASLRGMGTTVTAAGMVGDSVHFVQVGDSRGYILRDGEAIRATRDQTMVQEMLDLGLLSPEEAARSPRRNVLAQSVGDMPTVEPVATEHHLRAGDAVLVCSDGLTEVVPDEEIVRIVSDAGSPEEAARELLRLTKDRGGPDDTTVIVARVEPGTSPPRPG